MQTSRRQLLIGSLAGAAAVPFAASAAPQAAGAVKWDETTDVVIIGSGFAGLAAAIEAKSAGAEAVVLEKMRTPGGNSIINGGILSAPGCPQQKKHGIKDSPELLMQDMLRAGSYLNYPDKVRYIAERALDNYWWCINTLHVEFNPDAIGQEGGHSVPRYVCTKNGSGSGIVQQELKKLKELNVPIRLRSYVEHIFRNPETGAVEGVRVRKNYRFPDAKSGTAYNLRAKKGVILCYGGFGADVEFRSMYDPRLTGQFQTTNQPGATSEMWRETAAIGCAQIQQDWIQCGPWCNPREKGMGLGVVFNQTGGAEFGLWVNSKGDRFVNELANRKVRADAIFALHQQGMKAYAIIDANGAAKVDAMHKNCMQRLLDRKVIDKYNTLDELIAAVKLPNLKKSIAEVNESVKTGKDEHFGRYMNKEFKPLGTAPWYICECIPKVHHCMGGLVTTPDGRVVDIKTSKPIPGLWAAGESTGGVHGAVRLGSCATLDCLVMGRSVGKSAARA
ncbi:flavocytochrome c [Mesosutterella sp. AGMB02718]|uniref:Flavocytochrome c n=1 Tax=Mesosutterella faecium TaxID=2925194 RepID=A0ABT7IPH0_9BURK|nr:flavocytochrome c [Mesosutterella sp. AGMB02718]MDL2059776.1 flavocytochrome c [Mesosutterella sp. AGMB02718]